MEHELHLSVVNTGLYAGVGLPYQLSDLKPYLKDGDTIIIIPEYSQFFDDKDTGEVEPLAAMIGINPLSILYLHPKSMREIPLIGVTLFRHKANFALDVAESFFLSIPDSHDQREDAIKDDINFPYSRQGFNQYGDEVSHWNYTVQYDENYSTGSLFRE